MNKKNNSSKKIQIRFSNQRTPIDKTERTVEDIFRAAGQIMYNYYTMVLKKKFPQKKGKYTITLAK
ncbi:MAG: hypothetical protein AB1633_10545 [Elusimicrobiota bacterium]